MEYVIISLFSFFADFQNPIIDTTFFVKYSNTAKYLSEKKYIIFATIIL